MSFPHACAGDEPGTLSAQRPHLPHSAEDINQYMEKTSGDTRAHSRTGEYLKMLRAGIDPVAAAQAEPLLLQK
jgi:hypothetical protein